MGFSLGRALAGAIVGGSAAVADIADKRIVEATRGREADAAMDRQRTLMQEQDALIGARAERVLAAKTAHEEKKLGKIGEFYKAGLATLAKEEVNPGSIEGQRRLASMAAENGHPELADKFFDNAIKLGQIESTAELKKAEMATRAATIAASRAASGEIRTANAEARENALLLGKLGGMSNITVKDPRADKTETVHMGGMINGVYSTVLEKTGSKKAAFKAASDVSQAMSVAGYKGGDIAAAGNAAFKVIAEANWAKPVVDPAAPAPVPGAPAAKPKGPRVPGVFEANRTASAIAETPTGDTFNGVSDENDPFQIAGQN